MGTARAAGPATWGALLGCLAASAVALCSRGAPWAGEWGWTLDAGADTTTLTAPVVATFAAWVSYRWRGVRAIVGSSPRGFLVPLDACTSGLGVGVAALALSIAAAVAYSVASGPVGGPVRVAQLVPALLILAACAAAGAVVGTLLPHLLVIAVCPLSTFVLASLGFSGIGPELLRVNASTGGLAGITLRPGFIIAQTAGLLGLVGALLLVVVVVKRVALPTLVVVLAGGCSLLLLAGGSVALVRDAERYAYTDESATDCTRPPDGPLVCSLPSHRRARDEVADPLARLVAVLRAQGFAVPTTYSEQDVRPTSFAADRGTLELDSASVDVSGGDEIVASAAESAASPAQCAFWYADEPQAQEAYLAQALLADWILVRAGYDVVAWNTDMQHWLEGPSVDTTAWARTTYTALRECRPDRLVLPDGVGSR